MQAENLEGQESIFDRDSGSGKMSSALSQVGGTLKRVRRSLGRIFKKSSKRSSKLKNHTFMLLDLRPGAGNMLGAYRCQYHIVFAPKYRRKETYGHEYSAVPECSTVYGISQGKEQLNDFRQACEFEAQVWVEKFLV